MSCSSTRFVCVGRKKNKTNKKQTKYLKIFYKTAQVVIFVSSVARCKALCKLLVDQSFPAIAMHRAMKQEER